MELGSIIEGFVGKRVVVVGDVMVDEYVRGSVRRLSPEMPVPLLLRTELPSNEDQLIRLGGAGNAARNIASLGADVVLLGVGGIADPASEQLRQLIQAHDPGHANARRNTFPIDCRIFTQKNLLTTHKMRLLNNQSVQLFRVDTEARQEITQSTKDSLIDTFRSLVPWLDVVVVSDYAKGLISSDLFRSLRMISNGKPMVVDPKELSGGLKFVKYHGADIIIPNEAELRNSFEFHERLEKLFAGELQGALSHLEIKSIICTRGAGGILFSDTETDTATAIKGQDVEVADVTGASDTVTAAVALAIAQGAKLGDAAKIAEAAGRIKVTKRLTATVHVTELLKAFDPLFQKRASRKLFADRHAFLSRLMDLRNDGRSTPRVALVTGCFDILHRGHARLLELAAEEADIVAVAVNSDDYIRRSPHKIGGPYVDEISRATLIASLSSVDLVTIFDDDSPEDLYVQANPSLLVMGQEYEARYRDGSLPGSIVIKRQNIDIKFAVWHDTRTLSSSSIAQRIRQL